MTQHFLGVDVGASKTHILIADEGGTPLSLVQGDGANPLLVGNERFVDILEDLVDEALKMASLARENISAAALGVGGYDWPSQRSPLMDSIRSLDLDCPIELVNDTYPPILLGTKAGWGVSLIAGYSCNCRGWDQNGEEGRVTGFSQMGEGAGSHEIVVQALQAIAREWTLRGNETTLTDALCTLAGAPDARSLLEGVTLNRIAVGAEAAPMVFEVASEGDEVAVGLVEWAGRELGSLAVGVVRQLGLEQSHFELVLAGSFFNGSPVLQSMITQTVHDIAPGAEVVRLNAPPVGGSVLLAMKLVGLQIPSRREALLVGLDKLEIHRIPDIHASAVSGGRVDDT